MKVQMIKKLLERSRLVKEFIRLSFFGQELLSIIFRGDSKIRTQFLNQLDFLINAIKLLEADKKPSN